MTNATDSQFAPHPFELAHLGVAPFRVVGFDVRTYQACPEAPVQPAASCDFCGTSIKNVYTILSSDGRRFIVGCDCVAKTHDRKLASEVKALQAERRKAAREARWGAAAVARRAEAGARAAAYLATRPDLAEAFELCGHDIVADIGAKLRKYGSVSEGQALLVLRLYGEQLKAEAPGAAEPPAVPAPVTDKRVTLDAKVLGTRAQEGQYGTQYKMLIQVRTPEGAWKAWSTIPAKLFDMAREAGREHERGTLHALRGMRVSIKARVEVSKDDPCFAFLSRPVAA